MIKTKKNKYFRKNNKHSKRNKHSQHRKHNKNKTRKIQRGGNVVVHSGVHEVTGTGLPTLQTNRVLLGNATIPGRSSQQIKEEQANRIQNKTKEREKDKAESERMKKEAAPTHTPPPLPPPRIPAAPAHTPAETHAPAAPLEGSPPAATPAETHTPAAPPEGSPPAAVGAKGWYDKFFGKKEKEKSVAATAGETHTPAAPPKGSPPPGEKPLATAAAPAENLVKNSTASSHGASGTSGTSGTHIPVEPVATPLIDAAPNTSTTSSNDDTDPQIRIMNDQAKVAEKNRLAQKGSEFGSSVLAVFNDFWKGILARRMDKVPQHDAIAAAAKIADKVAEVTKNTVDQTIDEIKRILIDNTEISHDINISDEERHDKLKLNFEKISELLLTIKGLIAAINSDSEALTGLSADALNMAAMYGAPQESKKHKGILSNMFRPKPKPNDDKTNAQNPQNQQNQQNQQAEKQQQQQQAEGEMEKHPPTSQHPPQGQHPPGGEHPSGGPPHAPGAAGAAAPHISAPSAPHISAPSAPHMPHMPHIPIPILHKGGGYTTPQNGGARNGNNNKTRKNREYIHEIKENRKQLFDKEMEIINSIRNFKHEQHGQHGQHGQNHNKHENIKKEFIKVIKRK